MSEETEQMASEEQRAELEQVACRSREKAYAPYSNFRVGAAVLGESGAIYGGANIENASYSPTVCAERVAIFRAVMAGEKRIRAVAVCTEHGATPCGSCRQVMREFAKDLPVYIINTHGQSRETSLQQLLPDSFGPEHLEN
jgi:cytidine deaminase